MREWGFGILPRLPQKAVRQLEGRWATQEHGRVSERWSTQGQRYNGKSVGRLGAGRGVGRECVGEQWRKGRVELLSLSIVVGDFESCLARHLRGGSIWAVFGWSCEALKRRICLGFGGGCWGLARHGVLRDVWPSEAMGLLGQWALRGVESCETWSLTRRLAL
jgi:hypothetical protein